MDDALRVGGWAGGRVEVESEQRRKSTCGQQQREIAKDDTGGV
jgi:hypothetical protein